MIFLQVHFVKKRKICNYKEKFNNTPHNYMFHVDSLQYEVGSLVTNFLIMHTISKTPF